MSIIDSIGQLAHSIRRRREQARTERMIGSLPADIRKDIGWPDSLDEQSRRAILLR